MGTGLIGLATVWPCAVLIAPVLYAAKPTASAIVCKNAPAGRAQLEKRLLPIVAVLLPYTLFYGTWADVRAFSRFCWLQTGRKPRRCYRTRCDEFEELDRA